MNTLSIEEDRNARARSRHAGFVSCCALLLTLSCSGPAQATGIPVDGFLPLVGITLTNEYVDDFSFMPVASTSLGGSPLGYGQRVYDLALLDTGAAVSVMSTAGSTAFNMRGSYPGNSDGYRGTETITIGGASGFLEAEINDCLGIYAAGLQNRTTQAGALAMNNNAFLGQTNTSVITVPPESDLPNVLGLSFASQYATRIRNSLPQVFEKDGKTVRSPAVDFQPLGSEGMGITRKAQLSLLGSSPSTPLHFPNLVEFDIDRPWENPSQPTVVQGGHFIGATFSNEGASFNSNFFLDTGASVTVLSQFKALEMGFDVTLDTPEFTIAIVGSGGTLSDVPGFFVDQLTINALGGEVVLQNVPVIVLDVTNVSNPGNVVDGIIGMNVFQGRDIVIDPNPSLGGGGASPGLYISDPVTTNFNWASSAASAPWATAGSWSNSAVPAYLGIANVRHVSGSSQVATIAGEAQAFEVNISGGNSGQTMTLRMESGSKLTTFSGINVEPNGVFELNNSIADAQFIEVRGGGKLTGSGSIRTGSGSIAGQVEVVSGTVAPGLATAGSEIGSIDIAGRFSVAPSSTVQFDLASLTTGMEHDEIIVDGTVSLAGTLEVSLVNQGGNFANLGVGNSFTLISSTEGLGGQFSTLSLPAGYTWDVDYTDTDLVLTITSLIEALDGDFNSDGKVDLGDYTVWRDNLGGLYSASDYQLWKNNFGRSIGDGSISTATVPEPATWLVGLIAVASAIGLRRRN
ncbi:aspartyl protease family protein [Aeoliella sp. SH292]|uniref:aspartyl protease family protein n=1 Tax=Aeoliella sp. SH292 TaxID=3454464 RepID=UPI003F9C897F